jgi:putative ABC transport system permease protein
VSDAAFSGLGGWRLALSLARRELRGGLAGFRILIACLTLGVAAIAGVGSLSQALLTGLADDAREILGGDVAIRIVHAPASAAEQGWLDREGTVSRTVEMRAMARADTLAAERTLIELKAVDDAWPLYGTLATSPVLPRDVLFDKRGSTWGAAVDANLLDRLGIGIGDRLRIGEAHFEIRATIIREPDRAGGSGLFTLGPRVLVARAAIADTALVQPGSLAYYHYRVRLPAGSDAKGWAETLKATFPETAWRVTTLDNAAPSLRQLIDRTTLFMTLVGLTALLVGGVGVANAVRAYLDGKVAVIATLKCLGAPSALVFRVYLLQILALAGLGIAAGLALGAAVPLVAADLLQAYLPVAARIGVYPQPLLVAALFGLLTAAAFAIWPVARAGAVPAASLFRNLAVPVRMVPPRRYIAATALAALALAGLAVATSRDTGFALWFVAGAAGAMLAFLAAAQGAMALARRVRGVRRPSLRLALAGLYRPGAATASVVLSLGIGLTVLTTVALIQGNLSRQINDELPADAPSFFFVDIQPDQIEPFRQLLAGRAEVTKVESVPMLRGRITAVGGVPVDQISAAGSQWVLRGDRGITWSAAPPANSPLSAGTWWPADYRGPLQVSLDAEVARDLGVGLGDTLTINILGREFTATISSLREIDWRTLGINFVMVFSPGPLEAAPHMHIAIVHTDPAHESAVEREITDAFPNVSAIRVRTALETVNGMIASIGTAVRITAGVTLLAGTLVLAGAVAAGHRRRIYDSVVLKVLGATRRNVLATYALEYGLLGLVTAAIAALLGSIAAWAVLTFVMGIGSTWLPGVVIATGLGCTLVTMLAGFAGTWRALGHKAAPLLRNE